MFRRKRSPDGVIKTYKARYCVRGDLQEGEFSTFAPVVSWPTVRLFLVMAGGWCRTGDGVGDCGWTELV